MRLSELGELGLLAELEQRGLAEQIEDDAAELEPGLVVTQDSLVEGVHFRFGWLSWQELGTVVAVTGAIDRISDGEHTVAVANGDPLLAKITGSGCISSAITGCFLAVRPDAPLATAAEALVALGVAGEDAALEAKGPGSFHVALYDALYGLDPATLDERAKLT